MKNNKKIYVTDILDYRAVAVIENDSFIKELYLSELGKPKMGGVYLGKIVSQISGGSKYLVDIGDENPAILNNPKNLLTIDKKITQKPFVGLEVYVEVKNPPRAQKGAKLSSVLSLVGDYIIFHPNKSGVYVPKKSNYQDLEVLRQKAKSLLLNDDYGITLRTKAGSVNFEEIKQEFISLEKIYKDNFGKQMGCIYEKENIIRELYNKNNPIEVIKEKEEFLDELILSKIEDSYSFRQLNIDKTNTKITLNQLEALCAIDIDASSQNPVKANFEAIDEIAKQILIRNLSGIIIIDVAGFMKFEKYNEFVRALSQKLGESICKSRVYGPTKSGLVEIIRTRKSPSLYEVTGDVCNNCYGIAYDLSKKYISGLFFQRLLTEAKNNKTGKINVIIHKKMMEYILKFRKAKFDEIRKKIFLNVNFEPKQDLKMQEFIFS